MGKRVRGAGMAAAGLIMVAAPLVATQSPASAAQTSASGSTSLTFVDFNGSPLTCGGSVTAIHNTDDANHPFVAITESQGGNAGCLDNYGADLVVTYKDTAGKTQTTEMNSGTIQSARIGGAATAVHVKLTFTWFNCDSNASANCSASAFASPK